MLGKTVRNLVSRILFNCPTLAPSGIASVIALLILTPDYFGQMCVVFFSF